MIDNETFSTAAVQTRYGAGRISEHFTFAEMTRSDTARRHGISNEITEASVRDALMTLAGTTLEPLRSVWGKPMRITSGYRCPKLNALVGGVADSQHVRGEAADIYTGSADVSYALAALAVNTDSCLFDQLGISDTFVHISHRLSGRQRRQVFYYKGYGGKRL